MGGLLTSQSNASVGSDTTVAGLVSFGMSSSVWTNTSVGRTLVNAQAEYAPFGPNGLILLLGGTSGDSTSGLIDFANITFYDPITKQFFSQQATGTIPTGRQRFCSVGVSGPNSTFEVFLYGGLMADNTVSDEVFVLSLPGFFFAKADNPGATTARADHACVAVGNGKSQMLSIGGTDVSKGFPAEFADPDPWAQGLGVFDMTSLRWTDGYNNNAGAYDTPEAVKQFYRDGGLDKVQWTSDEVKGLFTSSKSRHEHCPPEVLHQVRLLTYMKPRLALVDPQATTTPEAQRAAIIMIILTTIITTTTTQTTPLAVD